MASVDYETPDRAYNVRSRAVH